MPAIIMESETAKEIWTSEEGSMARETALTRWPGIVQGMIDDLSKTLAQPDFPEKQIGEGRRIEVMLGIIKNEIRQDRPLHPLMEGRSLDIDGFNTQLESFGKITWHNAPWLFAECYLYRYVQTLFSRSTYWRTYDIFARQKISALVASHAAIEELSERYLSLSSAGAFSHKTTANNKDQFLIFSEMAQIALWGNATDLSLLSHLSLDQIHSLQGTQAIQAGQARIVSNDMVVVWNYLNANCNGRIDIVLDNSGFELFTDLVFALYLIDSGLAQTVRLHVKSIPWFVSDAMPHDVDVLLSTLSAVAVDNGANNEDPSVFRGQQRNTKVHTLAKRLMGLLSNMTKQNHDENNAGGGDEGRAAVEERRGAMSIEEHPFWTTGYDFHQMAEQAPDLLSDLRRSNLVIFKGDLNYRKLVRDAKWPHTLLFKQALGPLVGAHPKKGGEESGMKILALRTNKADVCVGVDKVTLERLENEAPDKAWVRSGRYAVVSFSNGVEDV